MDLVGALVDTELFTGFQRRDLDELAPSLRTRTYQRGASLWHAGDPVVSFVLVTSGLLKARHLELDGSEIIVQLVVPGETTGEFHLFDDAGRRYYEAIAVERSDVIVVPRDHLVYLLERDARLTMKLAATMLRRVLRFHDGLTEIQLVDLETRVARRLLDIAGMDGARTDQGVRIGARMSQSVLASMARATRENTNRALARLMEYGVIRVDDGHLIVCDESELTRLARR